MKKITLLLISLFYLNINAQQCTDGEAGGALIYEFTFQSTWNVAEHSSIPVGAHWSDLVVVSHKTPNEFMELGQNASLGIKNLAEFGNNTAISNEIQTAINNGDALETQIIPFNPNIATASIVFRVAFCDNHQSYLTLASMIAPSPDWFLAVNSLNVVQNVPRDQSSVVLDVFIYDAGTDNGVDYDSLDSPNSPVGISRINGYPFNGNKIGTLTVKFLATLLNTQEFNSLNNIKIFPNPSQDNITVSNIQNLDLQTIEIYNVLGKKVKQHNIKNNLNEIQININHLNTGLYLLKMNTKNGSSETRKLIIQ